MGDAQRYNHQKARLHRAIRAKTQFFRSADAYINSTLFEFKSPEGTTIKCVENNLQKALRHQSKSVVIDSLRVKNVRDRSIQNYLINRMRIKKGIKNLIFVTKTGRAIDIDKLV